MRTVFDYVDYKKYLADRTGPKGSRNGFKSGLAEAAGCNLTYISQILHGERDFSPEQAEAANAYLGHDEGEAHYFLLLLQRARAGTPSLRRYFEKLIARSGAERSNLKQRIGSGANLSKENQYTYYSSWAYAAVHVALSVPELRTVSALARYFNLQPVFVSEILDFLQSADLAIKKGAHYEIGPTMIHLGNDSRNILRHHANWRSRALFSLEKETGSDLHYSAAVTVSRTDAARLRERIVSMIKEVVGEIERSQEEEVLCLNVDFFGLKESIRGV